MKWHRRSSHTPEPYRRILACYIHGDPNFTDLDELRIYIRLDGRDDIKCNYWIYEDQIDLQKDIIENLHDSKKTKLPQYTGKRLISI